MNDDYAGSSNGQSVGAQVRQLAKVHCKKMFRYTASGARSNQARLYKLLDQFDAGLGLMVTRLGRLARSARTLLNTLVTIADRKAGFRPRGNRWGHITSMHGCLKLTILGGLAKFERDLIRSRSSKARRRADDDIAPDQNGATPTPTPQKTPDTLELVMITHISDNYLNLRQTTPHATNWSKLAPQHPKDDPWTTL